MAEKKLADYAAHREPSDPIRVFKSDHPRFNELKRMLTVQAGGRPFSNSQVIRYLLDFHEAALRFVNQEPLEEKRNGTD